MSETTLSQTLVEPAIMCAATAFGDDAAQQAPISSMSRKLKLLAALNVLGWAIVVPILVGSLLNPFIDFNGWPGSSLLSRPSQDAPLGW